MPLLHKPPPAAEPAAPEHGAGEIAEILAQLLARDSRPAAPAPAAPAGPTHRRKASSYDRLVTRAATLIGLLVCAVAWLAGACFTLAWLAALGFAWAAAALAPLAGLLPSAIAPATDTGAAWALLAWALPVGITLAEIGFDPGRARGLASRALWGGLLIVDASTTALGLYPALVARVGSEAIAVGLGTSIGLVLALVPEKLARRLIRENW